MLLNNLHQAVVILRDQSANIAQSLNQISERLVIIRALLKMHPTSCPKEYRQYADDIYMMWFVEDLLDAPADDLAGLAKHYAEKPKPNLLNVSGGKIPVENEWEKAVKEVKEELQGEPA